MRTARKFRMINQDINKHKFAFSASRAYCPIMFPNTKHSWPIPVKVITPDGRKIYYKGFEGLEYWYQPVKIDTPEGEKDALDMLVRLNGKPHFVPIDNFIIR